MLSWLILSSAKCRELSVPQAQHHGTGRGLDVTRWKSKWSASSSGGYSPLFIRLEYPWDKRLSRIRSLGGLQVKTKDLTLPRIEPHLRTRTSQANNYYNVKVRIAILLHWLSLLFNVIPENIYASAPFRHIPRELLSNSRFHFRFEEVEMAVREWLQMQDPISTATELLNWCWDASRAHGLWWKLMILPAEWMCCI